MAPSLKQPKQLIKHESKFIKDHIIEVTQKAFDDFAGGDVNEAYLKGLLGI